MQNDREKYLNNLLLKLDIAKSKGRNSIYEIGIKTNPEVISYIEKYFSDKQEYTIEIKKCTSCKSTYDIIIYIKK